LIIVQILPVFSLFAPCHPGASPPSMLNGFLTRDTNEPSLLNEYGRVTTEYTGK